MTDLTEVLPDFDLKPYRHLTHSLQKNDITVAELISLDPIEIARRCPLPLGDLKAMVQDIIRALHSDLGIEIKKEQSTSSELLAKSQGDGRHDGKKKWFERGDLRVKTLDSRIDECLGGGFPTGHITEIVGESAAGKTQFVLGLLLSTQLKPPNGLGKSAIYLSTEAPLSTTRLRQMLFAHPAYEELEQEDRPSLDRIHTMNTNDLEMQEHIVCHQLSIAVQRLKVGLIVMDSVAANFRAEHETKNAKGLADRAVDLTRLGNMLRSIAKEHNVAVVVTNQVSDRFDDARTLQDRIRSSSPHLGSSSPGPSTTLLPTVPKPTVWDEGMTLDHQQRFFTGWGDQPTRWYEQLKTPALGLSWANQLSARIVLKMESERVSLHPQNYIGGNIWKDKKKRRFVGVVFAPWVAPTLKLVEYEIAPQGIISLSEAAVKQGQAQAGEEADKEMLDPSLWLDGTVEDEEFP